MEKKERQMKKNKIIILEIDFQERAIINMRRPWKNSTNLIVLTWPLIFLLLLFFFANIFVVKGRYIKHVDLVQNLSKPKTNSAST